MTEIDQRQDTSLAESSEFSWDSLPEVAKERWEEMVAYSSTIENQLARAKSSRAQAEIERQRIAKEVLDATKEACLAVITDATKTLDKIRSKSGEADQAQIEANHQLEEAKTIRAEAETHREAVTARAEQQADEMLQRARTAAEAEAARLQKQVSFEAQRMLAQAEALRGAAREELEAQRIYAEAAMLKADAHGELDKLRAHLDVPEPLIGSPGIGSNENGVAGPGRIRDMFNRWDVATEAAPPEETTQITENDAGPIQSDTTAMSSKITTAEPAASQESAAASEPANGASPGPTDSEEPQKTRPKDRRIKAA